MIEGRLVAVDLETTGLNPKTERILEIGAVLVENGEVKDRFSALIDPRRQISQRIVELTGITDEMVAGKPDIQEALPEFLKFCKDYPLLGHHIIFDYSFLKRAAVNQGYSFERTGIDTLAVCRKFIPENEKKNLQAACKWFQVQTEKSHRALEDALAAYRLYEAMEQKYGGKYPEVFFPKELKYKVKREHPASKRQKEVLQYLIKYHKINLSVQLDDLSKNEASRLTDQIISQYGRIQ